MAPGRVTKEELARAARAALGGGRTIREVTRLAGGTTKGVYRLAMDDGTTVIAYLWEDSENYWPQAPNENDTADPFSSGNSFDLFAAEPVLARLREALAVMRGYRGRAPGKVQLIDAGGTSHWPTSEEAVLALGLRCVAEATERDGRVAATRERLEDRLRELAAAVRPRAEHSVVHGELGLDHVLVDENGNPVIIDIEDLMYFDVEWEHAHMQVRLGREWAAAVGVDDLDEDRLALYMLAQRLFLVAGPMRLLDGDLPDRAFMRSIIEHNLNEALALLP